MQRLTSIASLILIAPFASTSLAADKKPGKSPKPAIRISKKTTYFLTPVRKNGTIDYAAALNARASRGVTPANNAAALIIQVCSRQEFSDDLLKAYYRTMGIPKSSKARKRMLSMGEFAKQVAGAKRQEYGDELMKEHQKSTLGPWRRKDLPKLAAWLDANKEPLAVFVEALKRPRWYVPVVHLQDNSMLIATLLPMVQSMREVARALSARAMLAIHEGRGDDAIRDLLTCHKLARGVGHGHFVIDVLVGYAIEAITCMAEEKLLQSGKLNKTQLERFARALAELPPLPPAAKQINLAERCTALDTVQQLARSGPKLLKDLDVAPPLVEPKHFIVIQKSFDQIDWNAILEMFNREFDSIRGAFAKPMFSGRKAAFAEISKRLTDRRKSLTAKGAAEIVKDGKVDRAKLSQAMGTVLITVLTPALMQVRLAEDRNVTRFQLTQLAVALERYRKAHGRFPPKLADLQPRFFKKIPSDPYSGKPLFYKPTKTGYLLYAVGENGKDDGGRTFDSKPPADDIVVRITLAK